MCYADDQQAAHAKDEGDAEALAEMADYTAELSVKARISEIADGGEILFHEDQLLAELIDNGGLWQDLISTYFRHCNMFGDGAFKKAFIDAYKEEILKSRKS